MYLLTERGGKRGLKEGGKDGTGSHAKFGEPAFASKCSRYLLLATPPSAPTVSASAARHGLAQRGSRPLFPCRLPVSRG